MSKLSISHHDLETAASLVKCCSTVHIRPGAALLWTSSHRLWCWSPEYSEEVSHSQADCQSTCLQIIFSPVSLPSYSFWISWIPIYCFYVKVQLKKTEENSIPLLFVIDSYSTNDHYYASANLRYYQPNVYHYHSTPWHYRYLQQIFYCLFPLENMLI